MKNNIQSRLIGLLIVGAVSLNFNLKVFISIVSPVSDVAAESVQGEEAKLASSLPRPSTRQSEEAPNAATPAPSRAQRSFEIADYFKTTRFSELALDVSGQWLLYVTEKPSLSGNVVARAVRLQSVASPGEASEPPGIQDGSQFQWIGQSKQIAFLSRRSGSAQVWLFDLVSGRVTQLTHSAGIVTSFQFARSGKSFAFATASKENEKLGLFRRLREPGPGIIMDPWKISIGDFLDPKYTSDAQCRRLHIVLPNEEFEANIGGCVITFNWSSNETMLSVVYVDFRIPPLLSRDSYSSLGSIDVNSRVVTTFLSGSASTGTAAGIGYEGGEWVPSTNSIMARRIVMHDVWASQRFPDWTTFSVKEDVDPKALHWRSSEAYYGAKFFPQNEHHIVVENVVGGVKTLFDWRDSGASLSDALKHEAGSSSRFSLSASTKMLAYVNESLDRPPEVFLKHARERVGRRLTSLNADISRKRFPTTTEVKWIAEDGAEISGWLLSPAEKGGSTGPTALVVMIHGGPGASITNSFAPYFAYWPYPLEVLPAHGIAVFLPNYRGSHGYGKSVSFPSAVDKEPIQDVISGIRTLIARRIADPNRLALAGHSHGAWLGALITTRMDNIRATSFAEGTFNLMVSVELLGRAMNHEVYDDKFGDVYINPQHYLALSPSLHFDRVKSANLLEGGARGVGPLMLPLAKASLRRELPTEYVIYPDSGHNLTTPRLQKESAERNLEWFRKWINQASDRTSCAFQPCRTVNPVMADSIGAKRRKGVDYLPDCPSWFKPGRSLRIDSSDRSSMR